MLPILYLEVYSYEGEFVREATLPGDIVGPSEKNRYVRALLLLLHHVTLPHPACSSLDPGVHAGTLVVVHGYAVSYPHTQPLFTTCRFGFWVGSGRKSSLGIPQVGTIRLLLELLSPPRLHVPSDWLG